jgi:hypothetical protein
MRKTFLVIILVLSQVLPITLCAQNVTISPKTGKLVSALTASTSEVGFQNGFNALWRHNQLPLSFITADEGTLTVSGSLAVHACNFVILNEKLVDVMWEGSGYNILTLPKGYRFTGYKMVMKNNLGGTTIGTDQTVGHTGAEWKMLETNSDFDKTNPIKSVSLGTQNSNNEYVLERTSNDMGNTLYF